jgi:hypothetical protein
MSCHQDAVCPILSNGVKTAPVPPRREAEHAGGAHRAVVALAAAAILVAGAAAFFVFPSLRIHLATAGSTLNPARPDKSIAVLPFENLSGDPDDAFFADGVGRCFDQAGKNFRPQGHQPHQRDALPR